MITQPIAPHQAGAGELPARLAGMEKPNSWMEPPVSTMLEPFFLNGMRRSNGICVLLAARKAGTTSDFGLVDAGWYALQLKPPLEWIAEDVMLATEGMDAFARGAALAHAIDQMLFAAADVVCAQVQQLRHEHPELQNAPILIVGESLGALMTVGLLATGKVHFDAAVIVAGGGSCLDVVENSLLGFGIIPREMLKNPAFHAGYAATCRLDPLYAAPILRGCPIVLINATSDMVVPVSAQERLRVALGSPCTFLYEGGHLTLFRERNETFVPVLKEIGEMAIARVAAENAARAVLEESSPAESSIGSD